MSKELSAAHKLPVATADRMSPGRVVDFGPIPIRIDPLTGDLVIEHGKARIILQREGTIRLDGVRIVGMASERLDLSAAVIRMN